MADIIIKGMEMPPVCITEDGWYGNCPMDRTWCAQRFGPSGAKAGELYRVMTGKRPDWCPLRPAPEWISVDERLPESAGNYITAYHPCYWDDVKYQVTNVGIDAFRGKTTWAKNKHQRVTHWIPLPEPPEV
jgi:hypothetical protein